jgi:hypothetical protein
MEAAEQDKLCNKGKGLFVTIPSPALALKSASAAVSPSTPTMNVNDLDFYRKGMSSPSDNFHVPRTPSPELKVPSTYERTPSPFTSGEGLVFAATPSPAPVSTEDVAIQVHPDPSPQRSESPNWPSRLCSTVSEDEILILDGPCSGRATPSPLPVRPLTPKTLTNHPTPLFTTKEEGSTTPTLGSRPTTPLEKTPSPVPQATTQSETSPHPIPPRTPSLDDSTSRTKTSGIPTSTVTPRSAKASPPPLPPRTSSTATPDSLRKTNGAMDGSLPRPSKLPTPTLPTPSPPGVLHDQADNVNK